MPVPPKDNKKIPECADRAHPRSTLYDWDALYKGDPASLVNGSRRRKTVPARTVRTPEFRAAILKMRKRFAWGIEKICATLWHGSRSPRTDGG